MPPRLSIRAAFVLLGAGRAAAAERNALLPARDGSLALSACSADLRPQLAGAFDYVCDKTASWLHHLKSSGEWADATPPSGCHEYAAFAGAEPQCTVGQECPACGSPTGTLVSSVSLEGGTCKECEARRQQQLGATPVSTPGAAPRCNAWALLHVYKAGGTTMRQLAFDWATPGYVLPEGAVKAARLDPDADRLVLPTKGGGVARSLLEHARAWTGPAPLNVFVEHHSAPPHELDARAWRRSEFCSVCSCVLHVNLRAPHDYYASYLIASGPGRVSHEQTWDGFERAWREGGDRRAPMVRATADAYSRELAGQCVDDGAKSEWTLSSLLACLGLERAGQPANATAPLPFDVYGRVDHEADAYAAVMGAFGSPVDAARARLASRPPGAQTHREALGAGALAAVEELVDEAAAAATVDPPLFAAAFPADQPVRLRPGSPAAAGYRRTMRHLLALA